MSAVVPREGFLERLEGLREQRTAIEARIAEIEHWLRVLDVLEAEHSDEPATKKKRGT